MYFTQVSFYFMHYLNTLEALCALWWRQKVVGGGNKKCFGCEKKQINNFSA